MAIAWTPAMATGNDWLDREHRHLVSRLDGLVTAVTAGLDTIAVEARLRGAGDAALRAFSLEQDCPRRDACPAARDGGDARAELMAIMADFRVAYERAGGSRAVGKDLESALAVWVARHVPGPFATTLPCLPSPE